VREKWLGVVLLDIAEVVVDIMISSPNKINRQGRQRMTTRRIGPFQPIPAEDPSHPLGKASCSGFTGKMYPLQREGGRARED
jgi:hypothetical protein